jgi:hypothetical protein
MIIVIGRRIVVGIGMSTLVIDVVHDDVMRAYHYYFPRGTIFYFYLELCCTIYVMYQSVGAIPCCRWMWSADLCCIS